MACNINVNGKASTSITADRIVISIRYTSKGKTLEKLIHRYNEFHRDTRDSMNENFKDVKFRSTGVRTILDRNQLKSIFNLSDFDKSKYIYADIVIDAAYNNEIYSYIIDIIDKHCALNKSGEVTVQASATCNITFSNKLVETTKRELISAAYIDAYNKARELTSSIIVQNYGEEFRTFDSIVPIEIGIDDAIFNMVHRSAVRERPLMFKAMATDNFNVASQSPNIIESEPSEEIIEATLKVVFEGR